MKAISKIFFRGLVTLLPVAITIYILYSAIVILDSLVGRFLRLFLPDYVPGIGLAIIILLIFIFGLLLNNLIVARVIHFIGRRLSEVPFIKTIYSPLRDLMNLFSQKDHGGLKSVVLVKVGDSEARALGVVTRERFSDLNIDQIAEGKIAVYFPFSYGLGGYTFLVPRSSVTEIDLPIERAMSLAITGWVKTPGLDERKSK